MLSYCTADTHDTIPPIYLVAGPGLTVDPSEAQAPSIYLLVVCRAKYIYNMCEAKTKMWVYSTRDYFF